MGKAITNATVYDLLRRAQQPLDADKITRALVRAPQARHFARTERALRSLARSQVLLATERGYAAA